MNTLKSHRLKAVFAELIAQSICSGLRRFIDDDKGRVIGEQVNTFREYIFGIAAHLHRPAIPDPMAA